MKGKQCFRREEFFFFNYEHEIDKEMKDQQDDPGKGRHIFVPGMLVHATLHNLHLIIKDRHYFPIPRVEKTSALPR